MINWAKPFFLGNEEKYLVDAFRSTWISGGAYVDRFEKEFANIINTNHVITTSNGTTALNLALLGLDIGPGDEVIVPDFTFVAPGNTVLQIGATPVFVDVDKDTWNIDSNSIINAITPRTKAIIAVHLYGNVCNMEEIIKIAKEKNLYLIEDVAEAVFSKYNNQYAGTFGDVGCFSFQATKTITMGEGGAVVTNNSSIAEKMRKIRNHGMTSKRYWHDVVGYNYRLTNLQAAIGCAQLESLDNILLNKKRVYETYLEKLKDIKGINFQKISEKVSPIMWAVAIKIDAEKFKLNRDSLIQELLKKEIETRPGFYPFSVMPFYKSAICKNSEEIGKDIIVLPSYPELTEDEINYICNELKNILINQ